MDCIYETGSFFFPPLLFFLFFPPDLVLREHRKKKKRNMDRSLIFFSPPVVRIFLFFSFFFWTFEFRLLFWYFFSAQMPYGSCSFSLSIPKPPLRTYTDTFIFLNVCEGKQKKKERKKDIHDTRFPPDEGRQSVGKKRKRHSAPH